jgi:hypothetical protein
MIAEEARAGLVGRKARRLEAWKARRLEGQKAGRSEGWKARRFKAKGYQA